MVLDMRLKDFYYQMEDVEGIGLSDKGDRHLTHKHFYIDAYDSLFSAWKDEPIQLMELGIASGASLLMWSQYFTKGIITGLDIVEPVRKDYLEVLPNINMIFGDAYDNDNARYLVENLPKQDVFIEDGAHDVEAQITALLKYNKLVRPGGYYICEDLYIANLAKYLIDGVYQITDRNFTTTIFDQHRRINGLADDVMVIIQFLN
jgi:cephalosporin hydroxylase